MQSVFRTYLQLGFEHISDLNGYDHILFIVVLCALYRPAEWKKVAILVTAFTLGHSVTLALASLDLVRFPSEWIEFLIPVTIFLTGVYNIAVVWTDRQKDRNPLSDRSAQKIRFNYLMALSFGLIHGMGFSNFFRSAMLPGETGIFKQLLAFNLGVELGQLLIVGIIVLIGWLSFRYLKINQRIWATVISGIGSVLAFVMTLERIPV